MMETKETIDSQVSMLEHVAGKQESEGHMVARDTLKWTTNAIIIECIKQRKESNPPPPLSLHI